MEPQWVTGGGKVAWSQQVPHWPAQLQIKFESTWLWSVSSSSHQLQPGVLLHSNNGAMMMVRSYNNIIASSTFWSRICLELTVAWALILMTVNMMGHNNIVILIYLLIQHIFMRPRDLSVSAVNRSRYCSARPEQSQSQHWRYQQTCKWCLTRLHGLWN